MLALAASPVFTAPTRVFNRDIMGCTADGVSGNHLYSARALGMTEPGDAIQIHPDLKPQWPFITTHYDRVGLSYTDRVVWHVQHRGLARLAATEQVLEGPVHQGNRYPARHEPRDCVEPMAKWLYREGMRGVFAFDVAVMDRRCGVEYLAIECNPRFNGASYPTAIARKLGIGHWLACVLETKHRSLAHLDLTGLEYDPERGEGAILVNWGPILVGKLLFMLAGPPAAQKRPALALRTRL